MATIHYLENVVNTFSSLSTKVKVHFQVILQNDNRLSNKLFATYLQLLVTLPYALI
jgi:hypothetical protein